MKSYVHKVSTLCLAIVLAAAASARAANTILFYDSDGSTTSATGAVGGSGTWDTSSSQWRLTTATGALQTYTPNTAPSTLTADFAGTAGTVTIGSGLAIQANGITFGTTGYVIAGASGSTINLSVGSGATNSTPNITSSVASATISATLTGSSGLVKGGSGTLTLSGLNTYTGNTTVNGGVLSVNTLGGTGVVASALGAGTATVAFGSSGNSGTLAYTGSGESSDRGFTLSGGGGDI